MLEEISSYITEVLKKIYKGQNNTYSININDESKTFSEIEIEIWNGNNLVYSNSIIVLLNGREQGTKEELIKHFLHDFFEDISIIS
jgi:hypothetical protein